jgi:AraC-like DNA-binding protein
MGRASRPPRWQTADITTTSVDNPTVRTFVARYPAGHRMPWHEHAWDQLVYAGEGFLTVHVPGASWVVPADRGVWVPAGTPHTLEMRARTRLDSIYFAPGVADLPPRPHVVHANALVRALVMHIIERGLLDVGDPADARLVYVLLDQLRALDAAPLELREPLDPRARDAARQLRADPALGFDSLAQRVGASRRTLERAMRADTGMSLGQWRQRAQLLRALELLAAGEPVTRVATAVGYSTPSAFIASFRRVLGTTPSRFFAT